MVMFSKKKNHEPSSLERIYRQAEAGNHFRQCNFNAIFAGSIFAGYYCRSGGGAGYGSYLLATECGKNIRQIMANSIIARKQSTMCKNSIRIWQDTF